MLGIAYPKSTYRYWNLPTTRFMVMRKNLISKIDFSCGNDTIIVTEENKKIYNRSIGSEIHQDTGWMIPEYLYSNKLKSLTLPVTLISDIYYSLWLSASIIRRYGKNIWNMNQHNYKGYAFLTHCNGGRRSTIDKRFKGEWYKATSSYIKQRYNVNI